LPGEFGVITGRKPVALQARHISSTTSDFINFMTRAAAATNYQSDNYTFPKLRNQLREVTLNDKVKLNLVLIGSPRKLNKCIMVCDDDSYALDSDGNRILIGLTVGETREFERLDELISDLSSAPTDERRWLVLYDKHEAAVRVYLSTQNAKALRASRTE
jgi:hypothetical protein